MGCKSTKAEATQETGGGIKITPHHSPEERQRIIDAMDHIDHCPGCLEEFPHDVMQKVDCCKNIVCPKCVTGHGFDQCMVCDHSNRSGLKLASGRKICPEMHDNESVQHKKRVSSAMDLNPDMLRHLAPIHKAKLENYQFMHSSTTNTTDTQVSL
tara:strand:- start:206 stop:670 length:465 start_codon:yes stop_codon:yes gene_type:complete